MFNLNIQANTTVQCALLFDSNYSSHLLNNSMAQKYPELAFVVSDPDRFIAEMKKRFEEQKKKTPMAPHDFDYSELGLPLNDSINKSLSEKIQKFELIEKQFIQKQAETSTTKKLLRKLTIKFEKFKLDEVQTALKYYKDLLKESNTYKKNGSMTYKNLVEFSFFYSRAIGHFDTREYSFFKRHVLEVDRRLNGYKQYKIEQEYQMYKQRKFSVYVLKKAAKGFMEASESFEKAFNNPENLDTIWVPTNAWVERDIFMRLMAKNINLIGVTDSPIQADGFLRPGGDFNNHDVRHESDKYYRRLEYIEKNSLTEKQISSFERKTEDWWLELESEISKIKDPKLKEAVDLMAFNYHHDRGYPLMPSVFLSLKKDNVIFGLYVMLKLGGEKPGFHNPSKYFNQSFNWLKEFWNKRKQQEVDLILRSETLD